MSLKLALFAVAVAGALAQTSLYIPGADPQPLSADVLGVGSNGETTYLLQPGVASSTYNTDDIGLPGPATLIAGPTEAKLVYSDPSGQMNLEEDCTISGNIANCNIVAVVAGITTTDSETETVSPFEIQGGSTIAAAANPTGGASDASPVPSPAPSSGSSTRSSGASQTDSGTSGAPAPTHTDNGVGKLQSGAAGLLAVGMALSVLL